jgi:hypothetical protein
MTSLLRACAASMARNRSRWWGALAVVGVGAVFAGALHELLAPFFHAMSLYGFHDWDSHTAYRYVTAFSLKRYFEPPWWNPYLCGGFPAWAYVEGATNFVSPYLPFYLFLPIQAAERFEVLGEAITGLVSAYLLAGRFTRSAAVRALVAVAYAINGRWALQASVGHTWHLQYGWLPLALFFFDVSLDQGKRHFAIYAGIVLAVIVYLGGIYPLPHTALALVLYATMIAVARRSFGPFVALAMASLSGVGFAAPKLLPMIDLMMRYPRKIDSTEAIDLGQLVTMLTERDQSYSHPPAIPVPRWGWHEYGIYVGGWVVAAMLIGLLTAHRGKGMAVKVSGFVFLLLGMGAFHKAAPWTLLHELPVFSSQHVPTRFLFPAVLMLMLAFAASFGGAFDRAIERRRWIDLLLLIPVWLIALDIARVGRKTTDHVFYMDLPLPPQVGAFHQEYGPPYDYTPGDWSGATMVSMVNNVGIIGCYGVPDSLVRGAIARGKPGYRGEAYVVDATGGASATITKWTTNTATVKYENAGPAALLVYNMNYDPSWRANGKPAVEYNAVVATPVPLGSGEIRFSYYPRALNAGLAIFALTAFVAFGVPRIVARRRTRAVKAYY